MNQRDKGETERDRHEFSSKNKTIKRRNVLNIVISAYTYFLYAERQTHAHGSGSWKYTDLQNILHIVKIFKKRDSSCFSVIVVLKEVRYVHM